MENQKSEPKIPPLWQSLRWLRMIFLKGKKPAKASFFFTLMGYQAIYSNYPRIIKLLAATLENSDWFLFVVKQVGLIRMSEADFEVLSCLLREIKEATALWIIAQEG